MSDPTSWLSALQLAGRWADGIDGTAVAPADDEGGDARSAASLAVARLTHVTDDLVGGPGTPASLWALTKAAIGLVGAPFTVPAMTLAALRTAQLARRRLDRLPDHLTALAEGRTPPLPGHRTLRRPASDRYLITSDLHRCVPGRLDWPHRQRVKQLYAEVLEGYAEDGWTLIENGDIEDFWMVGGSTWGVVYDMASLTGAASGPLRAGALRTVMGEHLDRIVANNSRVYEVLRDGFDAQGRYLRTMGNHDDVFTDPGMVERLREHLPGVDIADTLLLTQDGSTADDGIDGVEAFVSHGHLTDSWNGPGFAALGRAITWLATGLDDLPRTGRYASRFDGRPAQDDVTRLMAGRARNRLITVDPRYGGNRRFDSLDEERMFTVLARAEPPGGWPWIVHGHTHFPMLWPHNRDGEPVRYANSGCGVLGGAFTALEWDPSGSADPLRLVVWSNGSPRGAHPRRTVLEPDGSTLRPVA